MRKYLNLNAGAGPVLQDQLAVLLQQLNLDLLVTRTEPAASASDVYCWLHYCRGGSDSQHSNA